MTKKIELTQGKYALVDDDDFEKISKYKWHVVGQYAQSTNRINGKLNNIYMHRMIMNIDSSNLFVIDHKNNDGLDNRKENLRICTRSDNQKNQSGVRGKSKYRGVSFYKKRNKWVAWITSNCRSIFIGYFDNEEDAARKYDEYSRKYHGEFGKRNFE